MRQKFCGGYAKAVIALASSLCVLTACSSGVVEEAADQTVAPLSRSASPSASASTTTTTPSSKAAQATGSQSAIASDEPAQMQDKAAGEVTEIPGQQVQLTRDDQHYLADLAAAGVDTAGLEDELMSVAQVLCYSNDEVDFGNATVQAMAGQLVEQGKATGTFEEVSAAIAQAARNAYC